MKKQETAPEKGETKYLPTMTGLRSKRSKIATVTKLCHKKRSLIS